MTVTSPDRPHDLAVVAVTYNSARDVECFLTSVLAEAQDLDLAVLVADNASSDGTLAQARASAPGVDAFPTGGNLGYSGAINAALRRLSSDRPVLILNPDSRVLPGTFRTMLDALSADPEVGAVVPRIRRADGTTAFSQRREPSLLRAFGDALFGAHLRRRPGSLSEMVYDEAAYEQTTDVDWATGAAVLLSPAAVSAVGEWDERFFLYSEETDYLRRVRDAGFAVRYVPDAIIEHMEGGSGTSPRLGALLSVNRVRYVRKHHSPAYATAFHGVATLTALLRSREPASAESLRFLLRESRWSELPRAVLSREEGDQSSGMPR